MLDHAVGVDPKAGFACDPFFEVGKDVHFRGVPPKKEGFVFCFGLIKEGEGVGVNFFVKGFHAFSGEGAGVGDWASGKAVDDAAWGKFLFKVGFFRVVGVFRFFFCIEVVEVAEKLIEAVCGGKHFIAIAEVVFAKLAGFVATGAEESGQSGVFFFEAFGGTWKADFG